MIQLKVSRTNSIYGSWKCEKLNGNRMDEPLGIAHTIQDAIEDYLRSCEILIGERPNYKWS